MRAAEYRKGDDCMTVKQIKRLIKILRFFGMPYVIIDIIIQYIADGD